MLAQDTRVDGITRDAIHTIRMYWDSFELHIDIRRKIYWGISERDNVTEEEVLNRLEAFQEDTMYLLHNWLKQFLEDNDNQWMDLDISTHVLHLIDYDRLFLAVMSKSFDTYPYIKKQIALESEVN